MIKRIFLIAVFTLGVIACAAAQTAQPVVPGYNTTTCPGSVVACFVPTQSTTPPYTGNGSLALTTASALVNTMTVNAQGAALPGSLQNLTVRNTGATNAMAFCARGGTCTCSGNAVASTNGLTIPAGQSLILPMSNIGSSTPTVVSCASTTTAEFVW